MSSTKRLEGKVALITGGSSGIGLATALRFVADGAYVFITGRRRRNLESALDEIGRSSASAVESDVSNVADLEQLFQTIGSRKGYLDIVFANAGSGTVRPLGTITEQQFDETFATNVKGVVFTVQGALPLLRENASVVLNASTAGVTGNQGLSIYGSSKAAVRSLARNWIIDLAGRGIRINVVSPGVVPTPGYDALGLSADQIQAFIELQLKGIPAGRVGTVDEVAAAVAFLASDDSSFINGVELFVDGGMTQV